MKLPSVSDTVNKREPSVSSSGNSNIEANIHLRNLKIILVNYA